MSDGRNGLLHDFELARLNGNVIEKDRGDHDPYDFEKAEGGAVEETAGREWRWL